MREKRDSHPLTPIHSTLINYQTKTIYDLLTNPHDNLNDTNCNKINNYKHCTNITPNVEELLEELLI